LPHIVKVSAHNITKYFLSAKLFIIFFVKKIYPPVSRYARAIKKEVFCLQSQKKSLLLQLDWKNNIKNIIDNETDISTLKQKEKKQTRVQRKNGNCGRQGCIGKKKS